MGIDTACARRLEFVEHKMLASDMTIKWIDDEKMWVNERQMR